ncbi:MAG: hypothetical protein OIF55_16750 [Amphritea sp.]|nr:hypothetical protein [Amphritea sp.]
MNTEALFIIGCCVLAVCALLIAGLALVIAGHAVWGWYTGYGVMNAIRPILQEI